MIRNQLRVLSVLLFTAFGLLSFWQGSAAYALIDLNVVSEANVSSASSQPASALGENVVEVKHKESVKLLALLPITITVTARTYADGRVEVVYPWYSFLTINNEDKIKTELKVAVDNARRSMKVGSVQAEGEVTNPVFSNEESVEITAEMDKVLQANFDGSLDVGVQ